MIQLCNSFNNTAESKKLSLNHIPFIKKTDPPLQVPLNKKILNSYFKSWPQCFHLPNKKIYTFFLNFLRPLKGLSLLNSSLYISLIWVSCSFISRLKAISHVLHRPYFSFIYFSYSENSQSNEACKKKKKKKI